MARHVHFKDGKFNLWSTIIDAYELSEWVDEPTIIQAYKEIAIEQATRDAKEGIEAAKRNGGCSVRFEQFRCKKEEL